jgi:GntR family transcriptional regulator, transcriptional repressor for pyruvate dehydrogenase complex
MAVGMINDELLEGLKIEGIGIVSNLIADRLRRLIVSEKLSSGFVFPNEPTFCEQLGVGRSSLREAYKVLESEKYITRTKRGTYVNDVNQILPSNSFEATIKISEFSDLLEFRTMIESELAGLAAQRCESENIKRMHGYFEKMKSHKSNLTALTADDVNFHMEIAKASRNKLLISTMELAYDTFFQGTFNAFKIDTKANIEQALFYHEKLLSAIEHQDPVMAKEYMRNHIQSIKNRVTK